MIDGIESAGPAGGFQKFPHIEGFHNAWKAARRRGIPETFAEIEFVAKVKLHGTHAAVRVAPDGTVTAQGRNRDLTVEADNFGFAAWVKANEGEFEHLGVAGEFVIYGEWAGPGIQKKVAVSQTDRKRFYVFAAMAAGRMIFEPVILAALVPGLSDCIVIPEHSRIKINFADHERTTGHVDDMNRAVAEIDREDPFIKAAFGISGIGEGAVFVPAIPGGTTRDIYSVLTFKVKGGGHASKANGKAAKISAAPLAGIQAFVDAFVTEGRLEQALEAIGGQADMRHTGAFLKWIGNDIEREGADELTASNLTWKNVASAVSNASRDWLIRESQKIAA